MVIAMSSASVPTMSSTSVPDKVAGVRPVKSAERTVDALELLSTRDEPLSLREIAEALHIPRASAYALLTTLAGLGWLTLADGKYRLGVRSLLVGAAFVQTDDMVQRARPVIDELSHRFNETVHLARLDHDSVVYLVTLQSMHSLSIVAQPGRRMPAWATGLGKSMLAERGWEDVESLIPDVMPAYTEHTITDHEQLKKELSQTRERGYAIDDQETALGLRCLAVAVGREKPPFYAISCPVPIVRLSPERESEIISALLEARQALTAG